MATVSMVMSLEFLGELMLSHSTHISSSFSFLGNQSTYFEKENQNTYQHGCYLYFFLSGLIFAHLIRFRHILNEI